ncbi:MAG: TlpA family protein disulfide reductase, partial [Candidatus Limnocylindria bacterium]
AASRSASPSTGASAPPSAAATPPATDDASASASPAASVAADLLLALALTDVRSGETFTLADLSADEPVLLEPMAVWCSNCRAQQQEVKRAHAEGSFVSVSLDVDLSESATDLADYADREGFDWRFAVADADLYRLLQERFGVAVTNPPSTPLIVIEPGGVVRPLEFGQGTRSAEALLAELAGD